MKKYPLALILFLFFCMWTYAQKDSSFTKPLPAFDTLINYKFQKMPCKIIEIGQDEIKYKRANNLDGPVYTVSKQEIREIRFANGARETIKQDELSMAPKPEVIDQRKAIKIHPFSPMFNKITVGYEQVLKMGINLEAKLGYINSNITSGNGIGSSYVNPVTGFFLTGGAKFLLGEDYYFRGMRYTHPMKGRYIRIDAVLTDLNEPMQYNAMYMTNTVSARANIMAYGFMINYGRQWILGNLLTLDYYVGLGMTGVSVNSVSNMPPGAKFSTDNISNYYGFIRAGSSPLSFTGGFTLGFLLK